MTPGKKARQVATEAIHAMMAQQGSLDSVLSGPDARQLSPGELALARMIASTTARHFFHLQQILQDLLERPFRAKDQIIESLLMGALAQLAFTRQAEHAVVAETVALAPLLGRPWARGVCNAVLRNFLRNKPSYLMQKQSEQAQLNHPAWLIGKLKKAYPDHYQRVVNANNQRAPMVLRANVRQQSPQAYLEKLQAAGFAAQLSWADSIVLEKPVDVSRLPGFEQAQVSVQDSSAQFAAQFLRCQPGDRVLDACAAPGGKTCHLLERYPDIELVALDNQPQRLKRVEQNLARLKLNAQVVCADAGTNGAWCTTPFDRILLDAPCSGTGVIRRHPDIRVARDPEQIKETVKLQRQILEHCWSILAPGGQLLYVTCSVLPEENTKQIQAFLQRHPEAELESLSAPNSVPVPAGLQILPGSGDVDGFYYASLVKSAPQTGESL